MRALFALCAVMVVGCGEPPPQFPTESEACIKDPVTYNQTLSQPPAPPEAEPPLEVPHELIAGRRISGDTAIQPDDMTGYQMARHGLVETTASFKICIDTAGVPRSVSRISSTCFPRYDERIRATMLTWRYSPYTVDGVPKPVCTAIKFVYRPKRPARPAR